MKSLTKRLLALPPLETDGIPAAEFYTERGFSSIEALELTEQWMNFDELHESDDEQSDRAELVHAWAIIAHFGGEEGRSFLIDELRVYVGFMDDLFTHYFPELMLARPRENGPFLRTLLKTEAEDEFVMNEIANVLAEFVKAGIDGEESLKALVACLAGDPRHRALKGLIVAELVAISSDRFLPEIRTAFEKNLVDVSINGDLEELEVLLGLLEKRSTPKPNWRNREEELAAESRAERLGSLPEKGDHAGTIAYFLRLYESPTSARSLAELDGLLLGAIVAPVPVSPATYLSAIWNAEDPDAGPEWESQEEAQRFLTSIMQWHDRIIRSLDDGSYHPPLEPRSKLNEPTIEETDWARGILKSVMFWHDSIEEPSDAHKAFAACALHLARPDADAPTDKLIQVEHGINAALLAREITQSEPTISRSIPSFASPGRAKPKIGRNDICFCGSGKKYKRCCMN